MMGKTGSLSFVPAKWFITIMAAGTVTMAAKEAPPTVRVFCLSSISLANNRENGKQAKIIEKANIAVFSGVTEIEPIITKNRMTDTTTDEAVKSP